MKRFRLYYKSVDIEFLIGIFSSEKEAEEWREFLAYCIREFPYEKMYIKPSTP